MATNTSATGGYLSPQGAGSFPPEDIDLDKVFQRAVVGVTAMPGDLVRPRWQPVTPKQPDPSVDWCAIGVTVRRVQDGPSIVHSPAGDGSDTLSRHEDIDTAFTFYGPNAQKNAMLLRDGLFLPQNIEALKLDGVSFIDCGDLRAIPELFNQQWIKRYDLGATFRRQVTRTYQVLNIVSADPILVSDEIGIISN